MEPWEQNLVLAQNKAWHLVRLLEERQVLQVGATEEALSQEIYHLASEHFGTTTHWHKRIVRTGINTVSTFRDNPPHRTVGENDLVYVDVGPVFDEFEGDVGKTYLMGADPDKARLVNDLDTLFKAAKALYHERPGMTGAEFFEQIVRLTHEAGWDYGNTSAGHLVGPFPHLKLYGNLPANQIRPENHTPMDALGINGQKRHWILEIHLVNEGRTYGGFFEDLLTL